MTQKEHDEKVNELKTQFVEAEKQIQDIRKELDELSKVQIEPESRRWKPKYDDTCYYTSPSGVIWADKWTDHHVDLCRYAIGNVFKTREEAEFVVERLKVIAELKEFAESDDRKWEDSNWTIVYSNEKHEVRAENWHSIQNATLYFESKERAEEAIKAVGKDRIKKYYLRINE